MCSAGHLIAINDILWEFPFYSHSKDTNSSLVFVIVQSYCVDDALSPQDSSHHFNPMIRNFMVWWAQVNTNMENSDSTVQHPSAQTMNETFEQNHWSWNHTIANWPLFSLCCLLITYVVRTPYEYVWPQSRTTKF